MVTNLYAVYVGGDRKNWRSAIEVRAQSRKEAVAKTREWLGDKSGSVKLSTRLKICGYSFHSDVPPNTHPLCQSTA